jgi:hypothetical protein
MNDINIPPYTLITYSRTKHGDPTGVIVAKKNGNNGDFTIGYAQCRKGDKFNKNMGLKIALGRAEFANDFHSFDNMPHKLKKMLPAFVQRCEKYYQVGR